MRWPTTAISVGESITLVSPCQRARRTGSRMAAGASPGMVLVVLLPPASGIFTSAPPECRPQPARALHTGSRCPAGSEAGTSSGTSLGTSWNQHLKVLEPPLITRVFTGPSPTITCSGEDENTRCFPHASFQVQAGLGCMAGE